MKWVKAALPDELHRWLRIRALNKDQTLSETIIELLEQAKNDDREKK
jgi:macrodomain Ter protein organizer (MatP/YcbG family)